MVIDMVKKRTSGYLLQDIGLVLLLVSIGALAVTVGNAAKDELLEFVVMLMATFLAVLLLLSGVVSGLFLEKEAYPAELFGLCCLVLAGLGIESLFTETEENRKRQLDAYKQVEEEVTKIREEALENVFDMNYALEHGHVIMTVSEAYGKEKQDSKEEEK